MDATRLSQSPLELWAGMECTVARVGDRYVDQLELSGHRERHGDLELFADLGITALRYPILWESVAPDSAGERRWADSDRALGRLRELGVRPIVGLVHHGSGPRHTSLLDAGFATGLAAYARAVAERYPWVDAWTPVNEPLTTARFSALYGHWYPHLRDDRAFATALLTQCRAVVLAMREIRRVNSAARLVQTEDLGKTFSTPRLAYQADFENERRWLTFDLLAGRLTPAHPLWNWLVDRVGVAERELSWFADEPCPADVIGINHYLSSERFLDERVGRYPSDSHGGNGRDAYADVLAARVVAEGPAGPEALLLEAWERYGSPLAVTELHNGCTREEQLRWVDEMWSAASRLRVGGVPVEAVTAWSLLGAFDWGLMLTRADGHYEPGVFDLRAPRPRPTALAAMFSGLGRRGAWSHAVLETPGWWRRDERLWYEPVSVPQNARPRSPRRPRPLLVVGARGTLGRELGIACGERGLEHRLVARETIDIADPESVAAGLAELRPWGVVNAAGYVRVDDAELDARGCFRSNTDGPTNLAAACAERGLPFVTFSSDLVFDGALGRPYVESDAPCPLSVYGRSKHQGEQHVAAAHDGALVVRTSAFFGPRDPYNFVTVALAALEAGEHFAAADDFTVSPTYLPDLVEASLDLFIDGVSGVWHLANEGAVTWAALARAAARLADADERLVEGVPHARLGLAAPRPPWSVLASERGSLMPALDDALGRYAAKRLTQGATGSRSSHERGRYP